MPDNDQGLDGGLDIGAILSPSTSDSSDTTGKSGADSGQSQGSNGESGGFKFGGRSYANQQAAEQAYNKLYGQYSDKNATFNQLKEALKNPELFAKFSKDPNLSSILAKMGIRQQNEDLDKELDEERAAQGQDDPKTLAQEIRLERETTKLEREEWKFERKLGRPVSEEERDQVLGVIARAPDLTYDEAWKLAFHEKMLKEAQLKAGAGRQQGNRPAPLPPGIPGIKLDPKKSVGDMGPAEWREHLRNSPEFQQMMSRQG